MEFSVQLQAPCPTIINQSSNIQQNLFLMYMPITNSSASPPTYFLTQLPFLQHCELQKFAQMEKSIEILALANQELRLNINQISSSLHQVKSEINALQVTINSNISQMSNNGDLKLDYINKKGKKYSKDRKCPIQGCTRRYSSKIALNSHLRKVHHIQKVPKSKLL